MKKISEILKVRKFDNSEVESYFKKMEKEIIDLALKAGKIFGVRNLPEPFGDILNSYIGDIKTKCESMITFLDDMIQAQSHIPEFNSERRKVQEEEERISGENSKIIQIIKNILIELEGIILNDINLKIRTIIIFFVFLFIAESIFNAMGFEAFGENLLFSMILGMGMTLMIVLGSHGLGVQVQRIESRKTRIIVVVSVLIIALPFFYSLAYLRNYVLAKEGVTGIGIMSFIIFNYAFFIISSFLTYNYWPTKEERRKYVDYKRLKAEQTKKEKELKNNNDHITKLHQELNKKAGHINHIIFYREYMVDRILKLYNHAMAIFIKNNILSREDRKNPDCFNLPYPELIINNHFESILLLTNNQQQ